MEQDLADAIAARTGSDGEPRAGLLTLTRRMDDEDQFDVDLTIMDFLTFKATEAVFEWRDTSDPHQSDLPSALVTMTAGMSYRILARRFAFFTNETPAVNTLNSG